MKAMIMVAWALSVSTVTLAQTEDREGKVLSGTVAVSPADSLYNPKDSLSLPSVTSYGQVMPSMADPLCWGVWGLGNCAVWDLHQGLNVSLGASVFGTFGHHSYGGTGFSQNVSALYAVPLTPRLSLAVGGYFNNIYWARDNYRSAGLTAILGYRFDEHWEVFVYGQKSLTNNRLMPYPLYDMNDLGDRIGAAVKYNFNPKFSVQISVEANRRPADFFGFPYVMESRPDFP